MNPTPSASEPRCILACSASPWPPWSAAIALRRGFERRQGPWNAALIAGAFYVLAVGIAAAALPAVNEVPAEFPATLLWNFRVSSFGMQLVMWATLGLGFGIAAEHALQARPGTLRRVVYQS